MSFDMRIATMPTIAIGASTSGLTLRQSNWRLSTRPARTFTTRTRTLCADNPPDNGCAWRIMGGGWQDIQYGAALDDSLFRLDPPQGYTVEVYHYTIASEKDMIEFLRLAVEFNDNTFPDQLSPTPHQFMAKINNVLKREPKDQTAAERRYIDAMYRHLRPCEVLLWDPQTAAERRL